MSLSDTKKTEAVQELPPLEHYALSQPLRSPLLRWHFLTAFFNARIDLAAVEATDDAFSAFFIRYEALCGLAINKSHAVSTVSHHRICEIRSLIQPGATYWTLLSKLQADDEPFAFPLQMASTVLDLVASVWLMITVGSFPGDLSYDEPTIWESGPLVTRSLVETPDFKNRVTIRRKEKIVVADRVFSPVYASDDFVKLPQTFTAANLEKIGGIEIHWTNNLADHLLLKDDDTKLLLFHHVSILDLQMHSPASAYPWDLMNETVRTISLLLPPILGQPNPWFLQEAKKHALDINAGSCKRLNSTERQIDAFVYWRQRLVLLKRTFDDTEPKTLSQLWNDDRKKTQWFTFWVAVLVFIVTVFFGVVQSVGTWVQAWAAVAALKQTSPTTAD